MINISLSLTLFCLTLYSISDISQSVGLDKFHCRGIARVKHKVILDFCTITRQVSLKGNGTNFEICTLNQGKRKLLLVKCVICPSSLLSNPYLYICIYTQVQKKRNLALSQHGLNVLISQKKKFQGYYQRREKLA